MPEPQPPKTDPSPKSKRGDAWERKRVARYWELRMDLPFAAAIDVLDREMPPP